MSEVEVFNDDEPVEIEPSEEELVAVEVEEIEEAPVEVPPEEEKDPQAEKRAKRKSQKQRQKEARDRTFAELDTLRSENSELHARLDALENDHKKQVVTSKNDQISRTLRAHQNNARVAEQALAKAIEENDTKAISEAMAMARESEREAMKLEAQQEALKTQVTTEPPPDAVPPAVLRELKSFQRDYSWWDPKGSDDDSRELNRLDRELRNKGYLPTEREYWDLFRERADELEKPVDNNDAGGENPRNRTRGPKMAASGRTRALKKGQVMLTKERRDAMAQMGLEPGSPEYKDMLKAYYEYDQRNPL